MSKTRRKTPTAGRPIDKKPAMRRCDECHEWFTLEELAQDRDSLGRPTGWFCGGCI